MENNKQLIKDLNEVTAWYQGRNVDACERVEEFIENLKNVKDNPISLIDSFDKEFNKLLTTEYKDTGVSWIGYKAFLKSKLQNGIKITEGNPVPSIDLDKLLEKYTKTHRISMSDVEAINMFNNWIQNGVETDNEYPKAECAACGQLHVPICSDRCAASLL